MNATTKTVFAAIMSAGVAAAFVPATAVAQGANQGWYKTCTKQETMKCALSRYSHR